MFSRSYPTIHHLVLSIRVQSLCCIITVAGVIQLSSTMCAGGKDTRAPGYPILGTCIVWCKLGTCIVWSLPEAGIVLCDTYWAPCCVVWYILDTVLYCVIRTGYRVVLCDTYCGYRVVLCDMYWVPCCIVWYILWVPCCFVWCVLGTVLYCVIRTGYRVVLCDTYWVPFWYVLRTMFYCAICTGTLCVYSPKRFLESNEWPYRYFWMSPWPWYTEHIKTKFSWRMHQTSLVISGTIATR